METKLEHILMHSYKSDMISFLNTHPELFEEAINLAISDKQPYAWRAAWLLWSCMDKNDHRIKGYIKEIISTMPGKKDSHLRDLMLILLRMELDEKYEGVLFSLCVDTWEQVAKKPSVRYTAFKMIMKIAEKHPELISEVKLLMQPQYMDSLSDSVKKSIFKLFQIA